jgi:hypothetical protein
MIKTLGLVAERGAMLAGMIFISASAFAQAPTDAQREAIRSACRSDYMAHCSTVPPGGLESLQCLQKNMSSLSGSCKSAVSAVEAPAAAPAAKSETPTTAPTTETPATAEPAKPATTATPATPKAAASTPAKKPSDAQIAAIRSACRSDYPKVCAGVPTGGAPALQCLDKNKSKVSSGCQQALNAAGGGAAPAAAGGSTGGAPAAGSAAAPEAAAPAVIVLRPMRPREELFVLRSACGGDVRSLCGGVAPGGGRIVRCLATNAGSLSPACKDVLIQFRAQ